MRREEDLLRFLGFNTQGDMGPWTFYTSARGHLVFFIKAPPLEPPSRQQIRQRNKFRTAGSIWRSLTPDQQTAWQTAAYRAHLQITGYNLFLFYITIRDDATIRTVERLAGITLIPLETVT